ncbi:hypothetical protein [Taibaiella soli]|uniref:Uncharacterized protein n=1 Tax=Taibaiella soli TaxID=1649169 RepID=A0A2W2BBP3_9BACT|nr:hypothetical protein [Taibaiella soli]PZF71076.1 hypothetical protein DN068_20475 [Taibaiella soli]
MKNVYKTILVWLLTALLGSTFLGFGSCVDDLRHNVRVGTDIAGILSLALVGGIVCLITSVPAIVIYHFLAVRLYRRQPNIVKVKAVLAFYGFVVPFPSYWFISIVSGDSPEACTLPVLAYAVAGLFTAQIFHYYPLAPKTETKIAATNYPE